MEWLCSERPLIIPVIPLGRRGGVSNDWCINPLFKFMTNETPICFSITSNAKTKNKIQVRFSKWCENEKRKLKFISVFQSEAKTKNKICFLMSCENKKCKWHLNSIFPCHRKTVGTKVHAFLTIEELLRLRGAEPWSKMIPVVCWSFSINCLLAF